MSIYTFVLIPSEGNPNQPFIADLTLNDPEYIARRLLYYDGMIQAGHEEACIALIVEE